MFAHCFAPIARPACPLEFDQSDLVESFAIPEVWLRGDDIRRGGRVFQAREDLPGRATEAGLAAENMAREHRGGLAISVAGKWFQVFWRGRILSVFAQPNVLDFTRFVSQALADEGKRFLARSSFARAAFALERRALKAARMPGDLCPACGNRADECFCFGEVHA